MRQKPNQMLFLLGWSHHNTPIEIREKLAIPLNEMEERYRSFPEELGLKECVLLSTCNRVEVYGVGSVIIDEEQLLHYFCPSEVPTDFHFWKYRQEVVAHLFNVVAGIDSQIVGETEIFFQVKQSYALAMKEAALGPVLNRIFQKSFQAAKWARTHTGVGRGQISIGRIAAELTTRIFEDLQSVRVLVLGTGSVGEKTLEALCRRGVQRVVVSGRTFENAKRLAASFGVEAVAIDEWNDFIVRSDIIICSAATSGPILSRETVAHCMAKRQQPLVIIDLAVPRNVDNQVSNVDGVHLYNLDDLVCISEENLSVRQEQIKLCCHGLKQRAERVWRVL